MYKKILLALSIIIALPICGVILVDFAEAKQVAIPGVVISMGLSQSQTEVALSMGGNQPMRLVDTHTLNVRTVKTECLSAASTSLSGDRTLAAQCMNTRLSVVDIRTGHVLQTSLLKDDIYYVVHFVGFGSLLAVASSAAKGLNQNYYVTLLDANSGRVVRRIQIPGLPFCEDASLDGSLISVGSGRPAKLSIIDPHNGAETTTVLPSDDYTTATTVCSDGNRVAAGTLKGYCCVMSTNLKRTISSWHIAGDVQSVQFICAGKLLAVTSNAYSDIYLYDPETGKKVGQIFVVGIPVQSLVSDRKTGQLFALSGGSLYVVPAADTDLSRWWHSSN